MGEATVNVVVRIVDSIRLRGTVMVTVTSRGTLVDTVDHRFPV